jgi:hypothetical protein
MLFDTEGQIIYAHSEQVANMDLQTVVMDVPQDSSKMRDINTMSASLPEPSQVKPRKKNALGSK